MQIFTTLWKVYNWAKSWPGTIRIVNGCKEFLRCIKLVASLLDSMTVILVRNDWIVKCKLSIHSCIRSWKVANPSCSCLFKWAKRSSILSILLLEHKTIGSWSLEGGSLSMAIRVWDVIRVCIKKEGRTSEEDAQKRWENSLIRCPKIRTTLS